MITPTCIIYHANCPDGFTAAWAAWKRYGDIPVYLSANYGDDLPGQEQLGHDLDQADHILILDFSWPRARLEDLARRVGSVRVLDHHATAQEALRDLPWATFDMNRSGAGITWDDLHESPRPRLIDYIEDRDLWRFKLTGSREVSQWVRSWPFNFETWDRLQLRLWQDLDGVIDEGKSLLRFQDQQVAYMADRFRWAEIGGHRVPVANATCFFSEVGEELCHRHPEAPFAAYYMDRGDGKRQWGARSLGFDCSVVAKALGGGGHPTAAGWVEDIP